MFWNVICFNTGGMFLLLSPCQCLLIALRVPPLRLIWISDSGETPINRSIPTIKVLALVFALLGVMTLTTGLASGQAISGNIAGTVVDSSAAAVGNADVNVTNINADYGPKSCKTNGTGEYRFDNLLAGFYKITVKASSFPDHDRPGRSAF